MNQTIVHVALVVRDYDEAIDFYTKALGFTLLEDTYQPEQDKRWVVVAPAGAAGTSLLLARATTPEQERAVGNQTGGRVFLFLATDDFRRDFARLGAAGVRFVRPPSEAAYGTVAVFEDLYGNRWDLVQYREGMQPGAKAAPVRDDEILSERSFPVPRDVLFAAFADPATLARWWGPQGFVNEFETFELRPGGRWRFVMRAPDGTAYPMAKEFVEVAAPERVVLRHFQDGHDFEQEMRFDALDARRARLRWRLRFDSPAEAARVRALVLDANEQNFDRLAVALGVA